jgi:anti-sigma B factor antagonist
MQIQSSSQDGVAVLTLDGDVLGGPDGSALHDALAEARGDGPLNAVVDLSGVRFMNSSGLGMLVGALTTARNTGGDLRLAAVAERVLAILQVTQLDGVFQRFDSVGAAVGSFAA